MKMCKKNSFFIKLGQAHGILEKKLLLVEFSDGQRTIIFENKQ